MRASSLPYVVLALLLAGCGPGSGGQPPGGDGGSGDAATTTDGPSALTPVSLAVEPPAPTLVCTNGAEATVPFTAVATYADGSSATVDASWSADHPEIGAIDWQTGLYTAVGSRAGQTTVTAALGSLSATATLTVRVETETVVPGTGMPDDPGSFFTGPAGTDVGRTPTVLYPETETVYPIGVYSPEIQWNQGTGNDLFRVRITDQLVSIVGYTVDRAFQMGPALWGALGSSNTGGPVAIEVSATSTQDAAHTVFTGTPVTLLLAQARLGGTVYYWDLDNGKILRIRPGTAVAEEFFTPPPETGTGSTCVACHTLSRDGRRMAFEYYGGGGPGGVADVATGSVLVGPGVYNAHFSTFNPDGSLLATSWSEGRLTVRDSATGAPWPAGSGEGNLTAVGAYNSHPAWSPDGGLLAYACSSADGWSWDVEFGPSGVCTIGWSQATQSFDAGSIRALVPPGSDCAQTNPGLATCAHFYPSFSADSRFIVYNQGETCPYGPRTPQNHLSLWLVSAAGGPPVKLTRAAGTDQDFYPNFSPFIEGGYHYVAFYSRRAYGWRTTPPLRQIWVTAIDQDPAPGADPSHPAFWLPGQSTAADNTSAFWAPEPCHQENESCETDLDCCSGLLCEGPAGARFCTPPPTPCVQPGNLCDSSADCCAGLTCMVNSAGEKVCMQDIG